MREDVVKGKAKLLGLLKRHWQSGLAISLLVAVSVVVGWVTYNRLFGEDLVQVCQDNFQNSADPAKRLEALDCLFRQGAREPALTLFYNLGRAEQLNLFKPDHPQAVAPQIFKVVREIYPTLDTISDRERNRALMASMRQAMRDANHLPATFLLDEMTNWEQGRSLAAEARGNEALIEALITYNTVLTVTHPAIFYDRAMAYLQLGQHRPALADFDRAIEMAQAGKFKADIALTTPDMLTTDILVRLIKRIIQSDKQLMAALITANPTDYAHLRQVIPANRAIELIVADSDNVVPQAVGLMGLNIDPNNPKGGPDPTEARELGVQLVRFTYYDSTEGPELDPEKLDFFKSKVEAYAAADIDSLILLTFDSYPNRPEPDAPDEAYDDYIEGFAQRCGQIASELAPWRPAFQVWTEPDRPAFPGWVSTLREAVYGRLLSQCYEAIKAAGPDLMVITAGLASGDPGWLARLIESLDGELPADAIAIHPYGQRPEPDWPGPDWAFGYVGDLIEGYYRAGQQKPIWITEMGVKESDLNNNREQAAEFLRRYYRAIRTNYAGKVENLSWYAYSDGMVPSFGLIDEAGNRKPAYVAFRQSALQVEEPTPFTPQAVFGEAVMSGDEVEIASSGPIPAGHNKYIYGLHDRGGEHLMMVDGEAKGWVMVSEAIGSDPSDRSGSNYQDLTNRGLGVIVTLVNAYGPSGTLPRQELCSSFAQRAANFVEASPGARIWVIGYEMNAEREQPRRAGSSEAEPITPRRYATCFGLVREAIKSRPGHEDDQVVAGAVGPWNAETSYDADPQGKYPANKMPGAPPNYPYNGFFGDYIQYLRDMLLVIGPENLDGIAIQAISHGYQPERVFDESRLAPPFSDYYFHFYTYRDQMNAIPENMRHLPVYIVRMDGDREANGATWPFGNNGWIKNAYQEINDWNKAGNQQIRAAILFRWALDPSGWSIEGKPDVQQDFREAIARNYQWGPNIQLSPSPIELTATPTPIMLTLGELEVRFVGSPNYNRRPDPEDISAIVMNASANSSLQGVINWFNNPNSQTSMHYEIDKDGTIVQFVRDKDRAWHAGVSSWQGRSNLNDWSIGIEFVNLNNGEDPYPEEQHRAAVQLVAYLVDKYNIQIDNIVAHYDVSPGRKTDPRGYDMDRLRREVAELTGRSLRPTRTPTPTFTPSPTAAPQPGPARTPIPGITCASDPPSQFDPAWDFDEYRRRLGCPIGEPVGGNRGWQPFERGYVVWFELSGAEAAYLLLEGSDAGLWQLVTKDQFGPINCPEPSTDPELQVPTGGIATLWCSLPKALDRLGYATDSFQDGASPIQQFERGWVWNDERNRFVYIFLDDGTFVRQPY